MSLSEVPLAPGQARTQVGPPATVFMTRSPVKSAYGTKPLDVNLFVETVSERLR